MTEIARRFVRGLVPFLGARRGTARGDWNTNNVWARIPMGPMLAFGYLGGRIPGDWRGMRSDVEMMAYE